MSDDIIKELVKVYKKRLKKCLLQKKALEVEIEGLEKIITLFEEEKK